MTRVSGLIQSELSRLVSKHDRLSTLLLTITHVDVSPDLRNAFVYVSTLNKNLPEENLISMLESFSNQWQREISSRLKIKYTPKLSYRFDSSLERGDRVVEILNELDQDDDDLLEES